MVRILPIGIMNIKTPKQFGEAVRLRRKQLKITQKDLALVCGTGLRFIVDVEKGKPTCHVGKILQVIQVLGLTIEVGEPCRESTG